jgi:hypothetical protein
MYYFCPLTKLLLGTFVTVTVKYLNVMFQQPNTTVAARTHSLCPCSSVMTRFLLSLGEVSYVEPHIVATGCVCPTGVKHTVQSFPLHLICPLCYETWADTLTSERPTVLSQKLWLVTG